MMQGWSQTCDHRRVMSVRNFLSKVPGKPMTSAPHTESGTAGGMEIEKRHAWGRIATRIEVDAFLICVNRRHRHLDLCNTKLKCSQNGFLLHGRAVWQSRGELANAVPCKHAVHFSTANELSPSHGPSTRGVETPLLHHEWIIFSRHPNARSR